jgi:hypothetical protein
MAQAGLKVFDRPVNFSEGIKNILLYAVWPGIEKDNCIAKF